MFRIEYMLHIKHDSRRYLFLKAGKIPFAPFVGLDILDDALGQFALEQVAWDPKSKMFLCQSNKRLPHLTVRQFCARLKAAGWAREKSDDDVYVRDSKLAEL